MYVCVDLEWVWGGVFCFFGIFKYCKVIENIYWNFLFFEGGGVNFLINISIFCGICLDLFMVCVKLFYYMYLIYC